MALKITPANEPIKVNNLCMTIYSQPGLGKTSLAFTASKPLLIDFDHGAYRAVDRGDVVQITSWSDVAGISQNDLAPYETIVIDTVGKALDALSVDIIKKNNKLGYGGTLNQQGWGKLGSQFSGFLKHLQSFGKDVILIVHMDEKADDGGVKERLKIQGGTNHLVQSDSDLMARISINNSQRELMFSPSETSFGKDPAGFGSLEIPDATSPEYKTFIGDILAKVKDHLNSLSEAQIQYREEVEWFIENLPNVTTPDEINALITRSQAAGVEAKTLLANRAKELGFKFDKTKSEFVAPEETAVESEEQPQTHEEMEAQ